MCIKNDIFSQGSILRGSLLFQPVSYTFDATTITVDWEGFEDLESGISTFELSLWKYASCQMGAAEILEVDWLKLQGDNYTEYSFVDLNIPVCCGALRYCR